MIVTFNVPKPIVEELNAIAINAGYANGKAMTIAYWRATIAGAREKVLRDAVPEVNTDDVVVS